MSNFDYYSEAAHGPHEIFELANYQLESGITLPNARIAYKTHGTLKICAAMTNCLPLAALPPVSGLLNPIFIGSAAIAGMRSRAIFASAS